jgi:hypothetical protein
MEASEIVSTITYGSESPRGFVDGEMATLLPDTTSSTTTEAIPSDRIGETTSEPSLTMMSAETTLTVFMDVTSESSTAVSESVPSDHIVQYIMYIEQGARYRSDPDVCFGLESGRS